MWFELDIGSKAAARVQNQYGLMGQIAPERAGDPPEIEGSYTQWWNAWQDLSTERQGMRPIPWAVMRDYAVHYSLDLELLKQIIWGLDEKYLEREKNRQAKQGQVNG